MGDCRAISAKPPPTSAMDTSNPDNQAPESNVKSDAKSEPMETDNASAKPVKGWMPQKVSKVEDLGKITFFSTSSDFGSSETTSAYCEKTSHCIVSPRLASNILSIEF